MPHRYWDREQYMTASVAFVTKSYAARPRALRAVLPEHRAAEEPALVVSAKAGTRPEESANVLEQLCGTLSK
jgi:hypothetical protein